MKISENSPVKVPRRTVIANGDGIVRICGEGISVIIIVSEDERVTLADCERLAEEQGFDIANDMALVVMAECETFGTVYKYGNHLDPKTKKWIWEKVGETVGYA